MKAKSARYIYEWLTNPARMRGRPALPTLVNFPITDNCNARCVMCDVWKTRSHGEMTDTQIRDLFRDPLFRQVRHVGISGGEPTLRKDLVDCVQAVVDAMPHMQSLTVTSHGFQFRRWETFLPAIARVCREAGIAFRLNLSMDGVEQVHNQIRGIPGGFERTMTTFDHARREQVPVQFQCTVSKDNVYNVGRLLRHARTTGVDLTYRQATMIERLDNHASVEQTQMSEGERSFFVDFLRSVRLRQFTQNPARRLFYRDLSRRILSGGPRNAPCYFQNEGIVVDAHGNLFHCSISTESFGNALEQSAEQLYFSNHSQAIRQRLLSEVCPSCVHDQSGAWSPIALIGETLRETAGGYAAGKASRVVRFGARLARVGSVEVLGRGRRRGSTVWEGEVGAQAGAAGHGRRAVVIGAYGGEHVGDAAILGGVLHRLHESQDVVSATVVSTRPDRTRMWCQGLESPVAIEVVPDDRATIDRALDEADLLVYGGGPVMDMPPLMVEHLATVQRGQAKGLPFIAEGVGIGPFNSRVGQWLGERLLRHAQAVCVRSQKAEELATDMGLKATLRRDPAFDYLAQRHRLTRVAPAEQTAIDRAVGDEQGAIRLAVNLRPMWRKYARGSARDAEAAYQLLLRRLAEGIQQYSSEQAAPVRVILFAMNADEYGFSDFAAAYDFADQLGANVDWRMCEHELGVDGVLALLRRVNGVVAMRFHAAIFALSQQIPTLGIDYDLAGRGKVAQLFQDLGLADQVAPMNELSPVWLCERLRVMSETLAQTA